jgi:diguanylate cyclase (GGDEF)-like protein
LINSADIDIKPEHIPETDVKNELIKLVFEFMPLVLLTNAFNASLISFIFYSPRLSSLVIVWLSLFMVFLVARGIFWFVCCQRDTPFRHWRGPVIIIGSALSGVFWGFAGFVFYAGASETQRMVLGFVLGGMGAGAVTALTPCLTAFYAFLLLSGVPFCLRLILPRDTEHLTMAAACILYLIALSILGRQANRWLRESVTGRFANSSLVRSLERRVDDRTIQLRELNRRLKIDIHERQRVEAALAVYAARQAAIADFGQRALSGIDLETLFNEAVRLVQQRLGVTAAALIENGDNRNTPMLRATAGHSALARHPVGFALGDHPQQILDESSGQTAGEPTGQAEIDVMAFRDPASSAEAVIAQHDRAFGVLVALDGQARTYSANDVTFLQAIANMLAAAIDRKRAEQDVQRLALQDPLTRLPNRALFRNQLQMELTRMARTERMLAVLLLDLDNFKTVNDTHGHAIGDRLLVAVAKRLKGCLRQVDVAARLGGDEFAIVLSELRSAAAADVVAGKVVSCLALPFHIEGHDVQISASVGVTVSPDDGADSDALLRAADLALYRAKTEGRSTHRFYTRDMAAKVAARKNLEHDLRRALDRNELFIDYQPQYDLATNTLVGAEALVRWQHPTRGLLMPNEFIPMAETMGLIVQLGQWVLFRVAAQRREWERRRLPPLFLSVNVSLSQCRRGDLAATVDEIAHSAVGGLEWLELELTEHVFSPPGNGEAMATLRHLCAMGVTISIDDFGKGYSSLARLKDSPVDKIKIDKQFVMDIGKSRDAEMIVKAIISLAKSLGIAVTAEGIENQYQRDFLVGAECGLAQGFFYSRPLPPDAFATLAKKPRRPVTGLATPSPRKWAAPASEALPR